MNIDQILFSYLDLPTIEIEEEILNKLYEKSSRDDYRNCRHIALYTSNGSMEAGNLKTENMIWTENAHRLPRLIEYVENYVFPWMTIRGRVAIICTLPGEKNPPHIDCSKHKFTENQLKFRQVLHGNVSDLRFITNNSFVSPQEMARPFLMAAEWPHEMYNTSKKMKYTLAIGSPWKPENDKDKIEKLLLKPYIEKQYFELECDYEKYFPE